MQIFVFRAGDSFRCLITAGIVVPFTDKIRIVCFAGCLFGIVAFILKAGVDTAVALFFAGIIVGGDFI